MAAATTGTAGKGKTGEMVPCRHRLHRGDDLSTLPSVRRCAMGGGGATMKGLSFSTPMMTAWLNGTKTLTRRLMNPQPDYYGRTNNYEWNAKGQIGFVPIIEAWKYVPYRPGETVYIKETWCAIDLVSGYALAKQPKSKDGVCFVYRAGCDDFTDSLVHKWFTPLFIPEWASRSHALIVSVRPERVQEITPSDCECEGIIGATLPSPIRGQPYEEYKNGDGLVYTEPLLAFKELWESIHPGSWERNDWVWRYELEKKP
jgi:hypothetical protein